MREEHVEFGERLSTARTASGLSIRALAMEAGLSPTTVMEAESGHYPNVNSLLAISRALGIPVGRLLGDPSDDATLERVLPGWGSLDAGQQQNVRALVAGLARAPQLDPTTSAAAVRAEHDIESHDVAESDHRPVRRRVAEDGASASDRPRGA